MFEFSPQTHIDIGPIQLQTWGTLIAIGFLLCVILSMRRAERTNIHPQAIFWTCVITLIATLIGARLGFVILFLPVFSQDPSSSLKIWQGGLVTGAGVIVGGIAGLITLRKLTRPAAFARALDVFPQGLALLMAAAKVSSFVTGDVVGSITDAPWSIVSFGSSRHPVALYEAAACMAIFGIMRWLDQKPGYPQKPGFQFTLFALLMSASFFLFDWFHATDLLGSPTRFYGFSLTQMVCACGALIAGGAMIYTRNKTHATT